MHASKYICRLVVPCCLAATVALGEGTVSEYPYLSRSLFWEAYSYDPFTASLYHCDEQGAEAAEDMGLDALLEGDDGMDMLLDSETRAAADGGADTVANANPVGQPARLRGQARSIEKGRFRGGVAFPGGDAMLLTVDHGHSPSRTLEFWLNPGGLPAAPATLATFMAEDMSPRNVGRLQAVFLRLLADGRLRVTWRGKDLPPTTGKVRANGWTHVAVGWSTEWPFAQQLLVHLDGHEVLRHRFSESVSQECRLGMLVIGNDPEGTSGFVGAMDEIRFSSTVRRYYPHDLDWPSAGGERPGTLAFPYVRDAGDLVFHLPFNHTAEPAVGAQGVRFPDIAVSDADLDLNPLKVEKMFPRGVEGSGIRLGKEGQAPEYEGKGLLDPREGTIAFWMQPVDWDNFTRDNRFDNVTPTHFSLFTVMGEYPRGSYQRTFKRAGPLMSFSITMHMGESVENPVPLEPGAWTHVAVTWH
jgi:hypothetical protein